MSVNEQTSAVFNAFIEADKALKELPAVKAELETVQAKLNSTADSLDHANSKANMLQGTIEALQAELHAKEAALAAATFRESQLSKVVDSIRGALPVVATGHSDVSVTDKANEGQSEAGPTTGNATSSAQEAPAGETGVITASDAGGSPNPTEATHNISSNPTVESSQSTESSGGHPPAHPTAHADTPNTNSGPSVDNASQREADPTAGPTPSSTGIDHDPDGSAYQRQNAPVERQSEANPTSDSANVESERSGAANSGAASTSSNLTYLGHYPHEKPSYLSWSEWDAMGGQTPPWYVRKA